MLHKLCRNLNFWDDVVVLSEPFGCISALGKGNYGWIDQEKGRNTIEDATLQ